jgi:two-component system chemotaxis response regulator CheB
MKILVLDPQNRLTEAISQMQQLRDDVEVIAPESGEMSPSHEHGVDIIVADGSQVCRASFRDGLLSWRTHADTHLVPCWISGDSEPFHDQCLWPSLSIDVVRELREPQTFAAWIDEIHDWQQSRMMIQGQGSLSSTAPIEFITALALRKATGTLRVCNRKAAEGLLVFQGGSLVDARVKHLCGVEGFFELLSWSEGDYIWESEASSSCAIEPQPLTNLVHEALRLVQDANLIFHFAPHLRVRINRTSSESALDDGAVAHFTSIKGIYSLINGKFSIAEIAEASPLSLPRTLSCLAKWFSLGDIGVEQEARRNGSCRVLIVDDSPFMCKALSASLSRDPAITVQGEAHDGIEALKLIDQLNPDVVTLDLQMPRMDGLTALKHIMIRNAKPVVVLSAFTQRTSPLTYQSFKLGAVDVLTKPSQKSDLSPKMEEEELCRRIREAGAVRIEAAQYIRARKPPGESAERFSSPELQEPAGPARGIVVVLCGVGGFAGLVRLLLSIRKRDLPWAVVACLDMPAHVVDALLPNIAKDSTLVVEPLETDHALEAGRCYLCSNDDNWVLRRDAVGIKASPEPTDKSGRQPFDRLLQSAKECFGPDTLVLLLSGNGPDGVKGMIEVKDGGGSVCTLTPDACLKPDLPRRVVEACGAREIKDTSAMAALLEQIH